MSDQVVPDQLVCEICGKDFPLGLDGVGLYRAHALMELAIQAGSARVSTPLGDGDGGPGLTIKTGQLMLPGVGKR